MSHATARAALTLLVALSLCSLATRAQDPSGSAPATVTGLVTDGKRPLAGVVVVLSASPGMRFQQEPLSAKTDADGRYRLGGVPSGRYEITTAAPAYVVASESFQGPRGRMLLLNPGETVENIDFRLTRGGVITGRVTDSSGRPVIGEQVQITPADDISRTQPPRMPFNRLDRSEMMTDDRGVYRVYGLAAGRYRVSVGRRGMGRGVQTYYQLTFYPGVTEEAQAKLVEVTAGGEATDIDITVNKITRQTYTVAGRFVHAETGQPAANVRVGFGAVRDDRRSLNFGGFGGPGSTVTNAYGEFRAAGFASGRYLLLALNEGGAEWYSEQVNFEVADADVEGLEIKLRRGASVSGSVQIEGVSDGATAARLLSNGRLYAMSETPGAARVPNFSPSYQTVAPDGSFRFGGLRAGRLRIGFVGERGDSLTLLRVEHNGVILPQGSIEVAEGSQVSGVRLVVARGTAVVRGQVNVVGGALPQGWRVTVSARRIGSGDGQGGGRGAEVDSRGSFIIQGMLSGDYELQAMAFPLGVPAPQGRGRLSGAGQRITVVEGGEHNITLELNVNRGGNQ